MTFKLDPVSLLALQKAKGWQQQSFGNTSPMSFSPGLVANKGSQIGPWGIMDEQAKIITPGTGVPSKRGVNTIVGDQIGAYRDQSELAMQSLGLLGTKHRSDKKLEFALELAKERRKGQGGGAGAGEGGGTSGIGSTLGGIGGSLIGGPIGGTIGSMAGNFIEGLFG